MKKVYLLCALMAGSCFIHAQTIITFGNNNVGKEEFLRAYNKNNAPVIDKEKSLREYLDLYSNFKLKVKAAEELRLDTLPQIQYDIENFRRQVEENYMNDEKGVAVLMDEAFLRSQKDIHAIHFSVKIDPAASPADSLTAFKNIQSVYAALQTGKTDYTTIASGNNVRYGDLGFITVFTVPYEFENILYDLKPSEISKPYRSKNAWHVFKVLENRKSAGKWKVAQILFSYPPEGTEAMKEVIRKKADSVYRILGKSANFSAMAKEMSDDRLTYMTGGELPEFGTGKYDFHFEKEIFKLKSDGEITPPFATQFGVHIVKRLGYTETPQEKENAALQYELKQKLLQDSRINNAKEKFAKEVTRQIGYKKLSAVTDADLYRYADSVSSNPAVEPNNYPISKKSILSFEKSGLKGSDWLSFVKAYKSNPEQYKGENNAALWNRFVTISALEYYKNHLEQYNQDFKYQMKEFKEGNMLFEIMERNVWSKAASDTIGLRSYYNANRSKYKWAASADVLVFNCSNAATAKGAIMAINNGRDWHEIADASEGKMQADSGRFEISQIGFGNPEPVLNEKNNFSPVHVNDDSTASFVKYIMLYPENQQRSFEEARGMVINDYQNVLEKGWLDKLHKKFPVKINETLVTQLLK